MVERRRDPDDRRRHAVVLTEAGEQASAPADGAAVAGGGPGAGRPRARRAPPAGRPPRPGPQPPARRPPSPNPPPPDLPCTRELVTELVVLADRRSASPVGQGRPEWRDARTAAGAGPHAGDGAGGDGAVVASSWPGRGRRPPSWPGRRWRRRPRSGALAWAGKVALAIPRKDRRPDMNPATVREPWRSLVRQAVKAEDRFNETVRDTRHGPAAGPPGRGVGPGQRGRRRLLEDRPAGRQPRRRRPRARRRLHRRRAGGPGGRAAPVAGTAPAGGHRGRPPPPVGVGPAGGRRGPRRPRPPAQAQRPAQRDGGPGGRALPRAGRRRRPPAPGSRHRRRGQPSWSRSGWRSRSRAPPRDQRGE